VINFGLFIFNMLPIPPLDGSHLYMTFLKQTNPELVQRLYQFGTWGLLILIVLQNFAKIEILPFNAWVRDLTRLSIDVLQFNS
jgi:Zn-dependent protease